MAVSSKPLTNYRPGDAAKQGGGVEPPPPPEGRVERVRQTISQLPWIVQVIVAGSMLVIGALGWWLGGSASLDGWVIGLNYLSKVIRVGVSFPNPEGTDRLVIITGLGVVYSCIEIWLRPVRPFLLLTGFLSLFFHGTDIGTTLLAVMTVTPDSNLVQIWAATWVIPGAIWAVLLTYIPEAMIIAGINILIGLAKQIWATIWGR